MPQPPSCLHGCLPTPQVATGVVLAMSFQSDNTLPKGDAIAALVRSRLGHLNPALVVPPHAWKSLVAQQCAADSHMHTW